MSYPRRPGPDTTPGPPLLHIRLHGWPDDEHTSESSGFVAQLAKTLAEQGLLSQVTLQAAAADSNIHHTDASQSAISFLDFLPGLLSPSPAASQADQLLRQALADRGVAYSVLYGSVPERLNQALELIRRQLTQQSKPVARPGATTGKTRWVWTCEKCSDPSCEHRLLTDLLARRAAAGP